MKKATSCGAWQLYPRRYRLPPPPLPLPMRSTAQDPSRTCPTILCFFLSCFFVAYACMYMQSLVMHASWSATTRYGSWSPLTCPRERDRSLGIFLITVSPCHLCSHRRPATSSLSWSCSHGEVPVSALRPQMCEGLARKNPLIPGLGT